MSIPRLAGFCLLLFFTFDPGQVKKYFLPSFTGAKSPILVGTILLLPLFFRSFFYEVNLYSNESIMIIIFNSFVVGFFEEALFRWGIFEALKERFDDRRAILLSSFLFMIFHLQAQELQYFPAIFLTGVVFSLLRRDGASLFWLAVFHSIYDCLVFIWSPGEESEFIWQVYECIFIVVVILAYLRLLSKFRLAPKKIVVDSIQ